MNDSPESERRRLRERRSELDARTAQLRQEGIALADRHDPDALKAHHAELHAHLDAIRVFTAELENFHRRIGPLGQ